jgi:hypothetical protein
MPTIKLTPAEAAALERRTGVVVRPAAPRMKRAARRRPPLLIAPSMTFWVDLPVVTRNESNHRQWRDRSRRTKAVAQAWAVLVGCRMDFAQLRMGLPVRIRLARLGGGRVDDDGLRSCLKSARDVVAQWVLGGRPGERDDDERIAWEYEQFAGTYYGVRVTIRKEF